jgi:hypothetical protein
MILPDNDYEKRKTHEEVVSLNKKYRYNRLMKHDFLKLARNDLHNLPSMEGFLRLFVHSPGKKRKEKKKISTCGHPSN